MRPNPSSEAMNSQTNGTKRMHRVSLTSQDALYLKWRNRQNDRSCTPIFELKEVKEGQVYMGLNSQKYKMHLSSLGLQVGDRLVEINDTDITGWQFDHRRCTKMYAEAFRDDQESDWVSEVCSQTQEPCYRHTGSNRKHYSSLPPEVSQPQAWISVVRQPIKPSF